MTESPENPDHGRPSRRLTDQPMPDMRASDSNHHPTCHVGGLGPDVEKIAQSASSVADFLTESRPRTRLHKVWHYAKFTALYFSVFVGSMFALEQYLASNHREADARVENLLLAASAALGDTDHIVQANAVRTLARVSEFKSYTVSDSITSVGQHLRASIFGYTAEYPYFEDSWLVLRDFATSRDASFNTLVSTQILREGAQWEHRTRQGGVTPGNWNHGSLLFKAQLAGAVGNDLDLSGIQFGAANLEGADLSGSDCSRCGLLGARLDGATLRGTSFDSAYLAEASISKADLSFAHLNNAVLRGASLKNAAFLQSDLTDSQFMAAKLEGAVFNQATLVGTDFTHSLLRDARFEQSDVSRAKFDGADIAGANFTRAIGFTESLLTNAINSSQAILPKPSEALK